MGVDHTLYRLAPGHDDLIDEAVKDAIGQEYTSEYTQAQTTLRSLLTELISWRSSKYLDFGMQDFGSPSFRPNISELRDVKDLSRRFFLDMEADEDEYARDMLASTLQSIEQMAADGWRTFFEIS